MQEHTNKKTSGGFFFREKSTRCLFISKCQAFIYNSKQLRIEQFFIAGEAENKSKFNTQNSKFTLLLR